MRFTYPFASLMGRVSTMTPQVASDLVLLHVVEMSCQGEVARRDKLGPAWLKLNGGTFREWARRQYDTEDTRAGIGAMVAMGFDAEHVARVVVSR